MTFNTHLLLLLLLLLLLPASSSPSPPPSDAESLLAFKSKADLHSTLHYSHQSSPQLCLHWQGVRCLQNRITHLVLQNLLLGGVFPANTLTALDQLRVLGLQNTSLTGPIPDLSNLLNLKSLFLDHNYFSALLPPSLAALHRLRTIDLSHNSLSGPLPRWLASLDRLNSLRLEWNRFNGSIPPLNQSSLLAFNVSHNVDLNGAIPLTPTLLRLEISSFSLNPNLCGKILKRECHPGTPFFGSPSPSRPTAPAAPSGQSAELRGVNLTHPSRDPDHHKRKSVIIGFSAAVFAIILSSLLLCFAVAIRRRRRSRSEFSSPEKAAVVLDDAVLQIDQQESELEERVRRAQGMLLAGKTKSGSLMFCCGEEQLYTLDQLMRASAELLGRGTVGTTYKAVLDSRLIVCVKRLDAVRLSGTSKESFESHMESVGGLRHPNLVPLRAYFQARQERLLVYDYQPNGSLHSLIHGSRSAKGKPMHWTSCLKIAEDVAQGLAYIHQAWRLVHGNLKSTNVLLGPEFEACIADYCLAVLADSSPPEEEDRDAAAYRAPEMQNSEAATTKSDVYSFGILLMELLTGRAPSELRGMAPEEMAELVRGGGGGMEEEGGGGNVRMEMLLEMAVRCRSAAAEQRPTMWQVLKMLQEVKETASVEDDGAEVVTRSEDGTSSTSV
ncbi:unnamed protein product [Linum tenue]|uniref:Protein kinase domain-containing protein n=1 Tax=Linum tenue TaxID=586396 RepID=A0AAV0MTM6_9ROSI|nr:unnamed protein product [Linum tenue]